MSTMIKHSYYRYCSRTSMVSSRSRDSASAHRHGVLSLILLAFTFPILRCAAADGQSAPLDGCRARAWVRAPDAEPGHVLHGDVRVRLDDCLGGVEVDKYELGLRFKERLFLKLRRPEYELPTRPLSRINANDSILAFIGLERQHDLFDVNRPLDHQLRYEYDEEAWVAYEQAVKQREAWLIHEEERVAFETRLPLDVGQGENGRWTTSFGLLVPWTNYPLGLDYRLGGKVMPGGDSSIVSVDQMYEYFVDIHLNNGTITHVPAGVTAFHPYLFPSLASNSYHVVLGEHHKIERHDRLLSNYSADIKFPPNTRLIQGQTYDATVILTREGYNNRTDGPTHLCLKYDGKLVPEHTDFHLANYTVNSIHLNPRYMRPVADKDKVERRSPRFEFQDGCASVTFPIPTDIDGEGIITTTSSDPIAMSVHIPENALIDFKTSYQWLGGQLRVTLDVSRDAREALDDNERSWWSTQSPLVDDPDSDWVPWDVRPRRWPRHLSGSVDISIDAIEQTTDFRSRFTSGTVIPTHYLAPDARAPVLVHARRVDDLRTLSIEERDTLAPLADPRVTVVPVGEEAIERYPGVALSDFVSHLKDETVAYVGDTWMRKVVPTLGKADQRQTGNVLVVQQP